MPLRYGVASTPSAMLTTRACSLIALPPAVTRKSTSIPLRTAAGHWIQRGAEKHEPGRRRDLPHPPVHREHSAVRRLHLDVDLAAGRASKRQTGFVKPCGPHQTARCSASSRPGTPVRWAPRSCARSRCHTGGRRLPAAGHGWPRRLPAAVTACRHVSSSPSAEVPLDSCPAGPGSVPRTWRTAPASRAHRATVLPGRCRAATGMAAARDQPGAFQHLEVLGDRGQAHCEGRGKFLHVGRAAGQPLQDRPARRIGQRANVRLSVSCIIVFNHTVS